MLPYKRPWDALQGLGSRKGHGGTLSDGDNELEHEDKIILYTTDSGKVTVSVRFEDDNF